MPKTSQKGKKQYTNPVRAAIAKSTGVATAGTRSASSKKIVNDSQLKKNAGSAPKFRAQTKNEFLDKMGVPKNRRNKAYIIRGNSTRVRHKSDVKDPNTGFGVNVRQIRRYKVITGS